MTSTAPLPRRRRWLLPVVIVALVTLGFGAWCLARVTVLLCCPKDGGPCQEISRPAECGPEKVWGGCSCPSSVEGGVACDCGLDRGSSK